MLTPHAEPRDPTPIERLRETFNYHTVQGWWNRGDMNLLWTEIDRLTQNPSTASVRDDALEEAALRACDFPAAGHGSLPRNPVQCARQVAMEITAAIRALKSPSPPVSGKEG